MRASNGVSLGTNSYSIEDWLKTRMYGNYAFKSNYVFFFLALKLPTNHMALRPGAVFLCIAPSNIYIYICHCRIYPGKTGTASNFSLGTLA